MQNFQDCNFTLSGSVQSCIGKVIQWNVIRKATSSWGSPGGLQWCFGHGARLHLSLPHLSIGFLDLPVCTRSSCSFSSIFIRRGLVWWWHSAATWHIRHRRLRIPGQDFSGDSMDGIKDNMKALQGDCVNITDRSSATMCNYVSKTAMAMPILEAQTMIGFSSFFLFPMKALGVKIDSEGHEGFKFRFQTKGSKWRVPKLSNHGERKEFQAKAFEGRFTKVSGWFEVQLPSSKLFERDLFANLEVLVLQVLGFLLPGFSLLDGMIRISFRHAFVLWQHGIWSWEVLGFTDHI